MLNITVVNNIKKKYCYESDISFLVVILNNNLINIITFMIVMFIVLLVLFVFFNLIKFIDKICIICYTL